MKFTLALRRARKSIRELVTVISGSELIVSISEEEASLDATSWSGAADGTLLLSTAPGMFSEVNADSLLMFGWSGGERTNCCVDVVVPLLLDYRVIQFACDFSANIS